MIERFGILLKIRQKNNRGFSLLELVIAVGVILVLTVGGLLAYAGFINNARNAAVQSAASEVLTGAAAFQLDNKNDTNGVTAEEEWNRTSKKDRAGKAQIVVKVEELPGCLKVTATHVKGNNSIRQSGTECVGGDSNNGVPANPGDDNEGENPGGNEEDVTIPSGTGTEGYVVETERDSESKSGSLVSYNNKGISGEIQISSFADLTKSSLDYRAKDIDGLPVGSEIWVSEYLTKFDGYSADNALQPIGTKDGKVGYKMVSRKASSNEWISAPSKDNNVTKSITSVETSMVLPAGESWNDLSGNGVQSVTADGRNAITYTHDWVWPEADDSIVIKAASGKDTIAPSFAVAKSGGGKTATVEISTDSTTKLPVGTKVYAPNWLLSRNSSSDLAAVANVGDMTRYEVKKAGYYFQFLSTQNFPMSGPKPLDPANAEKVFEVTIVLPDGYKFEDKQQANTLMVDYNDYGGWISK